MEIKNITFEDKMFVYAAESAYNPSRIKVTIPEVFLDGSSGAAKVTKTFKGNMNIFVNTVKPSVSNSIAVTSYIELPVTFNMVGSTSINVMGSRYNGSTSVGLGSINVGDRLIAEFIGNSPSNGIIVARC